MQEQIEKTALRLREAYHTGTIQPLRDVVSPTDAETAYAIQACNTQFWIANGRKITGRKVGLTAKAVQAQLGVDQPDFGVLFQDMQVVDGGSVPFGKLIQPKAEAEIALLLKSDLTGSDLSLDDIYDAVEAVIPAIEIVDSRISDWKITFADTVSDNGSSAMYVLGKERRAPRDVDLYTCGMVLEVNGAVVSIGAGAACLGHPMNAALWLARTLVERGDPLKAGEIVLTGALGPMVPVKAGDSVIARIGGVGSCRFSMDKE